MGRMIGCEYVFVQMDFYLTDFTGIQVALIQPGSWGLVCWLDRSTMVETWYSAGLIVIHAY